MPARKSVVTSLLLVAGIVLFAAAAQEANLTPLAIQEQGSFAVGGTVATTLGTFDPIAQGAYNPAGNDPTGQTLVTSRSSICLRLASAATPTSPCRT